MTGVVVYSRPGCHRCEEALAAIVALHEEGYRFGLHEIDIESEELLLRRYLERIPVVEVDGVPRRFEALDGRFRYAGVAPGGHEARFRLPGLVQHERRSVIVLPGDDTDAGVVTLDGA